MMKKLINSIDWEYLGDVADCKLVKISVGVVIALGLFLWYLSNLQAAVMEMAGVK